MNARIKDEAKRLTQGIRFNLFLPLFLISVVNAVVSSTIIGSVLSMVFVYIAEIFMYKFAKNGTRTFSAIYEDYNSIDNLVSLIMIGLRMFLYMFAIIGTGCIIMLLLSLINEILGLVIGIILTIAMIAASIIINIVYGFVGYIAKDAGYRITSSEAFDISKTMTAGKVGTIFMFHLSFIGHFLLVAITFGIYGIWFMPYYETAKALLYIEMRDEYLKLHHDILSDKIRNEGRTIYDDVKDFVNDTINKMNEEPKRGMDMQENMAEKNDPFSSTPEISDSHNVDPFDMDNKDSDPFA